MVLLAASQTGLNCLIGKPEPVAVLLHNAGKSVKGSDEIKWGKCLINLSFKDFEGIVRQMWLLM